MKFLVLILCFFVFNKKENLIHGSFLHSGNFLNLFKKKSLADIRNKEANTENNGFKKFDLYNFLTHNHEKNKNSNCSYTYFISNKKLMDIKHYRFKHDLDFESKCELKQSYMLQINRLEISAAYKSKKNMDLLIYMEEDFIEMNEKTFSILLNENPESLIESFSINDLEFSPVFFFKNLHCFSVISKVITSSKPIIFKVFCVEAEM